MPLTAKGEEIKGALEKEYGAEKGERVLYAGKNKGTFTGIDAEEKGKKFEVTYRPAHGEAPTQGGENKTIKVSAKSTEHAVKLANAQTGANWQRTGVKEIKADSATLTRIADAINNLQQRFDAICSRNDADEKYWSFKPSSRTPSVNDLPKGAFKGTQEQFSTLSPGMRREIERSAAKQRV